MVFAYVENRNGLYKKSSFEIITYARYIANQINEKVIAITINPISSPEELYQFGADEVIELHSQELKIFDVSTYSKVLIDHFYGKYFILPHSSNSTAIAANIAIKKNSSLLTNLVSFPKKILPFMVKRKSFSGKLIMEVSSISDSILMTISPNSIDIITHPIQKGICNKKNITLTKPTFEIKSIEKYLNKISLEDAEIVISAGRGMKSPKNWKIIEDLANKFNAAISCSKPVSDLGWRPHEEHVGQTGKIIAPTLYFAIGISGAIQHISGINHSKIIIVINSDPEAPFFKFANYGIIGDAFVIIPKLIECLNYLNKS